MIEARPLGCRERPRAARPQSVIRKDLVSSGLVLVEREPGKVRLLLAENLEYLALLAPGDAQRRPAREPGVLVPNPFEARPLSAGDCV